MKIAILILLIYSIFGLHITIPIGYIGNREAKICSDNLCVLVALILYCIMIWQKGVNNGI